MWEKIYFLNATDGIDDIIYYNYNYNDDDVDCDDVFYDDDYLYGFTISHDAMVMGISHMGICLFPYHVENYYGEYYYDNNDYDDDDDGDGDEDDNDADDDDYVNGNDDDEDDDNYYDADDDEFDDDKDNKDDKENVEYCGHVEPVANL